MQPIYGVRWTRLRKGFSNPCHFVFLKGVAPEMRLVWWRFERVTPSLHFVHTTLGGGGGSRAFAPRALNCAVPLRTRGLAMPPSSGDGNSDFSSKNERRLHSLWFRVLLDFPKNLSPLATCWLPSTLGPLGLMEAQGVFGSL